MTQATVSERLPTKPNAQLLPVGLVSRERDPSPLLFVADQQE